MKQDHDFDSFFDHLMTEERIEDNGFSDQVLKQIRSENLFSFFKGNVFECLAVAIGMIVFRADLFLMNSYLKVLDTVELFSRFNGADFSISIHRSTLLVFVTVIAYILVEKGSKIVRDI